MKRDVANIARIATHPRREKRRHDARVRQAAYDSLSDREKYDRAVSRGHEHSREALRLSRLLDRSASSEND